MLQTELLDLGFDTLYFQEPSKSKWGRKIKEKAAVADSLTPEEELDLFVRDRKFNVENNLKPAIKEKKIVILDRYYYSTIAYQGAKGLDAKRIRLQNEKFVIKPDLVIFLDIPAEEGLERIRDRKTKDMLFEREEYLKKVREIFCNFQGENFFHFDARLPILDIHEKIKAIVLNLIKLHTL